ncbi:LLM class flavin-dependent oxidoreductase [Nocardioides endophyticus]|uniref:LLM class flavin-dependent oxidoreductase n=1 Tax=Nocardioides endophyticus TaxID=1353775 RepID=A0ABP8YHX3_9ACTN
MNSDKKFHLNLIANSITLHAGLKEVERAAGVAPSESRPVALYSEYAAIAEEGNFTSMFLADTLVAVGSPLAGGGSPEPFTALAAVAARTRNIGLIATGTTSFYEPYNLARLMASLDLISDGRAGWNCVTGALATAAPNFGSDPLPPREERYARADEFLDVVSGLWDRRTLRPNERGGTDLFAEAVNHHGKYFDVEGPLNVAPSRQGRPLVGLAGGSGSQISTAIKHADVVFTNAVSREVAAEYRSEMNQSLVAAGRKPDSIPIMPMIVPFLGATRAEAEERKRSLDMHLEVDAMAPNALANFGISYSYDDVDDPFPVDVLPHPQTVKSTIGGAWGSYRGLYNWIQERPGVTVREVTLQASLGQSHQKFVGSYDDFCDDIELWFREGLAAGFLLMCPEGLESANGFVEHLVPRLIDRGIYRTTPDERPLRERFTCT